MIIILSIVFGRFSIGSFALVVCTHTVRPLFLLVPSSKTIRCIERRLFSDVAVVVFIRMCVFAFSFGIFVYTNIFVKLVISKVLEVNQFQSAYAHTVTQTLLRTSSYVIMRAHKIHFDMLGKR